MPPPLASIDHAAIQRLDEIVARAFGIDGGYRELNGILSADGVAGFNMFEEYGLSDSPMKIVVPGVREQIQARGDDLGRTCLRALYLHLEGNFELRLWLAEHCPDLHAEVPKERFEAARAAYELDRMERRVRVVGIGLSTIGAGLALNEDQKTIARMLIRKLDELNDYKIIHDTLHGLQGEVMAELTRLSGEDIVGTERRQSLEWQTQQLALAIDQLEGKFNRADAPELAVSLRATAVTSLANIRRVLRDADQEARETPEAVAGLLRAMLRQQLAPFDSKLVETVDEIPFDEFAAMLGGMELAAPTIGDAGDPILAANIGASFEDIRTRLVRRKGLHHLWQHVESTLLNIEELLRGSGREIELQFHWQNLSQYVDSIAQLNIEPDIFELPLAGGDGAESADFAANARSRDFMRAFDFFARGARVRFKRADNALLNDCEKLGRLQQPLRVLVGD